MKNLILLFISTLLFIGCSKNNDVSKKTIVLSGINLKALDFTSSSATFYDYLDFKTNNEVDIYKAYGYSSDDKFITGSGNKYTVNYSISDDKGYSAKLRIFGKIPKAYAVYVFGTDSEGNIDFTGDLIAKDGNIKTGLSVTLPKSKYYLEY